MIDAIVMENVLREINMILDVDLVFYNYNVEMIHDNVASES